MGLAAALAAGVACTPNNSVKSGAPVLTELSILEPGAYGPTVTTVTASTMMCPSGTAEGGACDPATFPTCETVTANVLCRCLAGATPSAPPATTDAAVSDAAVSDAGAPADAGKPDGGATTSDAATDAGPPPPAGAWSCSFAPTASIMYVFDRVLDSTPLDPGDAATVSGLTQPPKFTPMPPSAVALAGDYASNGSPNEIVFPLLGDFRSDGPSILFAGVPALPAGTTISVTLDNTKVLAKDGRTPFTGMNLLKDGAITFVTAPFSVAITPPPPPMVDAAADAAPPDDLPDMTPATLTFTNLTDPATIAMHVTATAGAATPVAVDVASMDGLNYTVTPKAKWPASSTITITVDAAATDVVGDTLGTAAQKFFNTSAM
ncbi:MAG TPA: Ig-like domain-containing protein [Polyangia bacterium]|nr:Ig-like domain-containing protein [Polyangia bacterium]